jgi:hypothetical protein
MWNVECGFEGKGGWKEREGRELGFGFRSSNVWYVGFYVYTYHCGSFYPFFFFFFFCIWDWHMGSLRMGDWVGGHCMAGGGLDGSISAMSICIGIFLLQKRRTDTEEGKGKVISVNG